VFTVKTPFELSSVSECAFDSRVFLELTFYVSPCCSVKGHSTVVVVVVNSRGVYVCRR